MKDVTLVELNKDTGMDKLLEWLDNRFKKDENTEGFNHFNPMSTGLFYLVTALGGGGVPPPLIKFDPDILEH